MAITQEQADWYHDVFTRVVDDIELALVGKRHVVELAVACLFAQGHLLIEDVPGNGKTLLARSMAKTVLGTQARIQFTPDLAPDDITGTAVFDDRADRYRFYPGPIFNTLVLADEINRAAPRTQAALLEVMEEGRVTVRGVTKTIGPPFMVIATQNPIDDRGTYELPEAQLDRFLMSTTIGYPDADATMKLIGEVAVRDRSEKVTPLLSPQILGDLVFVSNDVEVGLEVQRLAYAIAELSRRNPSIRVGLSTRACLSFVRAAKTWAAAKGRTSVLVDDLIELAVPALAHRIVLTAMADPHATPESVIVAIVAEAREAVGSAADEPVVNVTTPSGPPPIPAAPVAPPPAPPAFG